MNIGLIVAISREIDILLNENLQKETIEDSGYTVYKYKINNNDLYVIQSGCGEIASSAATQYLITKYNVQLLLNYGVAGALHPNLNIKDAVIVKEIFEYDLFIPGETYQFDGKTYTCPIYKCDSKLIDLARSLYPNLTLARCCSGNRFIETRDEKLNLFNSFNGDICEMEAAGVIATANKNNVPVLFIKGISDGFSDNSMNQFNEMVTNSSKIIFNILMNILQKIN